MNVLFIFSRHSKDPKDSTLTKDLSDEFHKKGANVYVMTMEEKRHGRETSMTVENGYNILRVQTGNYFNCKTRLEKIITILTLPYKFVSAAKTYLHNINFDLIVTHTPFVSSHRIIVPLKRYFHCPSHLILWDIFPQNAYDIGIIRNKYIFNYFKRNELKMLGSYNKIWCMSKGNVDYMVSNYPELSRSTIDLLYNSSQIKDLPNINKLSIRSRFGYRDNDVIAIFGGNMGIPQALDNVLNLASRVRGIENAQFLFIGDGTEFERLKVLALSMQLKNTKFIKQVAREEYEEITFAADIGIVSLDERFTVPNFPSKTIDYFKLKLPILASLDECSAKDYGYFLTYIAKAGMFALASDEDELFDSYFKLYSDSNLRLSLGNNGRKFYEHELDVARAYKRILGYT